MPKYVIIRTDVEMDNKGHFLYRNRSGNEESYTKYLQDAQTYDSKDEAQKECCGNERVIER